MVGLTLEDENRYVDSLTKIGTVLAVIGGIVIGVWQYTDEAELTAVKPIRDKQLEMYEKVSNETKKLINEKHIKITQMWEKLSGRYI